MAHTFVKDIMKQDLISLDAQQTIKEAASKMDKNNVGCVIVTKENKPVGIVTERDFVRRVTAKEIPLSTFLEDIMSSPLIVLESDETVWEAAQIMKTNNIHKVPISYEGKIIGIVTTSDLVKICSVGSDSEMRRICDQILTRMRENQ